MPRLTETAPNRITAHEITIVSDNPLIGLLTLESDDGTFEFAFNRSFAEALIKSLAKVTNGGED